MHTRLIERNEDIGFIIFFYLEIIIKIKVIFINLILHLTTNMKFERNWMTNSIITNTNCTACFKVKKKLAL